jgi:uncharacterized protein
MKIVQRSTRPKDQPGGQRGGPGNRRPGPAASQKGAAAGAAASADPQAVGRKNWRVTVSRDKLTAFLDYAPRDDLPKTLAAEIFKAATELGIAPSGLFDSAHIDKVLRNSENSGITLRQYPICADLAGGFEIRVSEDKASATLMLQKGRGAGKPLELKEVGAALRTSGIKRLDLEKIKTDILTFYRSTDTVLEDYELAAGKPAEKGADQDLTWDVEFMPATKLAELKIAAATTPESAFKGIFSMEKFPMDVVQDAVFVKDEQIIASATPAVRGIPGIDVFGKTIGGMFGSEMRFVLHEHCTKQQNDIVSGAEGVLDRWEQDGAFHLRVRPQSDAEIIATIAPDAMSATVDLIQGQGTGTRLHPEDVRQALITAGVIRGIDLDEIGAAVAAAEARGKADRMVVARGELPQNQAESSLSFRIEVASGRGVTIKQNGRADYRNQDRITIVEEGTLIAEIVSPDANQEGGFDVRGQSIEANKVQELNLNIGEHILQEKDDEGRIKLIAGVSGELAYDGKSIDIVGVHSVTGDVGPTTGNIRFSGPVNISGNVLPGYVVIASGTVKIAEGVEAALVSSEKSVHIVKGVKGGGKAAVRAREGITASFAEQVVLMSVRDITMTNSCLQCSIKCNGRLNLTTEKGRLVGGQTKSRSGVEAAAIGSKNGSKTHISFGQDYLIGDKIDLEQKELEKLKVATVETEALIREAEKDGNAAELAKHRAKKLQILKMNEKRTERLFWLREKFEQHYDSEVIVRGTAYPGVTLESHGRTHEITTEMNKVVFYFNQEKGILEDRPLSAEEN